MTLSIFLKSVCDTIELVWKLFSILPISKFYFSVIICCFILTVLTLSVLWINGPSTFIKLSFSLNQYMHIKVAWTYKPNGPSIFYQKKNVPRLSYDIVIIIFQIYNVTVHGLVLDFATLKSRGYIYNYSFMGTNVLS